VAVKKKAGHVLSGKKIESIIARYKDKPGNLLTFHFADAAVNVLTNPALDTLLIIPKFEACAEKIEPAMKPQ
jgi:hypothetical protein